jgi:hypothetical protein
MKSMLLGVAVTVLLTPGVTQAQTLITTLSRATLTGEAGVMPITATSLQEAIALGQTERPPIEDYSLPLAVFEKANTWDTIRQNAFLQERMATYTRAPFGLSIVTPYVNAMLYSAHAKRTFAPVPTLNPDLLNANKVILHVSPGSNMNTVDTIENVVIKRGSVVVRPLKSDVKPTAVSNAMGMTKPSATADFTFDFSAFAPDAPITLVCIGQAGNWEWLMTTQELALLR